MADDVLAALKRHAAMVDQTVSRFLSDLDNVVAVAQATLQNELMRLLALDADGIVKRTSANQRTLRRMPILWQQALDRAGFAGVIDRYMDSFPAQIPAFQEVLQAVNYNADNPLPIPEFTAADKSYFNALKLSAGSDVSGLVENAAAATLTRTIFAAGTLSFKDLVKRLVDTTGASVGRAETIANTSLQAMYRTVASTAYTRIENELDRPLLYDYRGPDDQITRPACHAWVRRSIERPFTKDEIDHLNNGTSFMPVWTYGGGPNCRHSIVVSLRQSVANEDS